MKTLMKKRLKKEELTNRKREKGKLDNRRAGRDGWQERERE